MKLISSSNDSGPSFGILSDRMVSDPYQRLRGRYVDLKAAEAFDEAACECEGLHGNYLLSEHARSMVRRLISRGLTDVQSHERWAVVDVFLDTPRPVPSGLSITTISIALLTISHHC